MKKIFSLCLFCIIALQVNAQQKTTICGKLLNCTDSILQIDPSTGNFKDSIKVNPDGTFNYTTTQIKAPFRANLTNRKQIQIQLFVAPGYNLQIYADVKDPHIQAVKFAALDYLLKPVNPDELVSAVKKAESRLTNKKQNEQLAFLLQQIKAPETNLQKIALPQQNEIRYVAVSDIMRCEADNNYTFFNLINGDRILVSKPLKEYSDLLKPYGFLRIHQSHLVNPSFVKSWLKEDGGMLLMKNGDKISVSKPNREMVKEALGK